MATLHPRVCSEHGGQERVLPLSLDPIEEEHIFEHKKNHIVRKTIAIYFVIIVYMEHKAYKQGWLC